MNPSRRCSSPARALALLLLSAPAAAQGLTFERNAGQWPAALHARANVAGSSAWFHADGVTLQLRSGAAPQSVGSGERATVTTTVRMQFANGAQHAPPVSEETDATTCTSLRYRDVWPGIDTVFRGVDGRIAYEFDVVAGASAASIEFACEGLTAPLSIAADGSLVLTTAEGTLRHTTPHSFELGVDGERLAVPCAFALRGPHRFGFTVDRVDPERPLWIDPGIDWMTYFGGAGEDFLHFTTHVSGGLFAVTGVTDNTVPAPWNLGNPGGQGCYAALIDADSGNAVWSTALSGSGHDHVFGIDYNAANARVTVVGVTSSSDLPTTPDALQPTFGGTYDGFVAQLDLAGNLVYLSYVGGTGDDRICDVHVGNGIVTLAGVTRSPTLPMAGGGFQPALAGGSDAFVYQLDLSQPPTSQLVRSTFVGTANGQGASFNPNSYWKNFDNTHVHVAPSGEVTIALRTGSQLPALPTTAGALAANPSGGIDTWVGRFDPQLTTLLAGTYLGGSNLDAALAMEVDDSGHVVLALTTASPNLATTSGAFDTTWSGSNDCYLCRLDLNATGASQLLYGTYFGGSDVDEPNGLVLAPSSDLVTVVGQTRLAGFGTAATPGAFQSTPQISTFNTSGFAIRLAMEGSGADDLHYASYLLPGGTTTALDVAQDEIGRAWIVGSTFATAVGATTSGPQVNLVGANDGFAVRMDLLPDGVDAVGVGGPGCAATAYMQVDSQPRSGNSGFTMRCENAPPSAIGLLVLGAPAPTPVTVFGLDAYVQPITTPALLTDARGFASYDLPIPAGANGPYGIAAQFAWLPNNPCAGFLSTSNALRF